MRSKCLFICEEGNSALPRMSSNAKKSSELGVRCVLCPCPVISTTSLDASSDNLSHSRQQLRAFHVVTPNFVKSVRMHSMFVYITSYRPCHKFASLCLVMRREVCAVRFA